MKNFRLFQIERLCRRQFQIWRKWQKVIPTSRKTLWGKEKLLVMSNFSFSHSVFTRLVSQGHQKVSLCGNGLKPYYTILNFDAPSERSLFKNFVKKKKKRDNAINQYFLQCLLACQGKFARFKPHINCPLQMLSIWTRLKIFILMYGNELTCI